METCKHGKATPDGGMCWECDDERSGLTERHAQRLAEAPKTADQLYAECESNKCTGCDNCNNCEHGEEINCCEVCSPPPKCGHGIVFGDDCEKCSEDDDREMESDMPSICEHDIEEDDCSECQAKFDRMADAHRDQQDWNHFHPSEE